MAHLFSAMDGLEFIKLKQQSWAKRQGLGLVCGTISGNGERNYLNSLRDNLFEELSQENSEYYHSGDGNETEDTKNRLAKMKALYSSSALVLNLFQYWQGKDAAPILAACGLWHRSSEPAQLLKQVGSPSFQVIDIPAKPLEVEIKFEQQFEISKDKSLFPHAPNLDVFIHLGLPDIAIEAKFAEPYRDKPQGLSKKYIEGTSFWNGMPNLYGLAKEISPDNTKFQYLDAAQLIKHILGLKKHYEELNSNLGTQKRLIKKGFRLLYLWYDVLGEDSMKHRAEIEEFAEIAQKDNVKFSHITYQEVIAKLSKEHYAGNEKYLNYLTDRYL